MEAVEGSRVEEDWFARMTGRCGNDQLAGWLPERGTG